MHLDHPWVVHWGTSIGVAYIKSTEFGYHVYFVRSDDNGATWNTPVLVREAYQTGFLSLTRAVGGTYDGRLMLVYSDVNPNGWGGSTGDTRKYQIWTAYSTNNGNSWTNVQCFNNGEGFGPGNSYRTISPPSPSCSKTTNKESPLVSMPLIPSRWRRVPL